MSAALQQVLYVFVPIWVGGIFIFSACVRAKIRAYRRRLPLVDGIRIPVDPREFVNPFGKVGRAMYRADGDTQADPELERLRMEMRYWQLSGVICLVVLPLLFACVAGVLLVVSLVRP